MEADRTEFVGSAAAVACKATNKPATNNVLVAFIGQPRPRQPIVKGRPGGLAPNPLNHPHLNGVHNFGAHRNGADDYNRLTRLQPPDFSQFF